MSGNMNTAEASSEMRSSPGYRWDRWAAAFWFWKPCLDRSRALSVARRRVVRVRQLGAEENRERAEKIWVGLVARQ